jgi:hypothetical protein
MPPHKLRLRAPQLPPRLRQSISPLGSSIETFSGRVSCSLGLSLIAVPGAGLGIAMLGHMVKEQGGDAIFALGIPMSFLFVCASVCLLAAIVLALIEWGTGETASAKFALKAALASAGITLAVVWLTAGG